MNSFGENSTLSPHSMDIAPPHGVYLSFRFWDRLVGDLHYKGCRFPTQSLPLRSNLAAFNLIHKNTGWVNPSEAYMSLLVRGWGAGLELKGVKVDYSVLVEYAKKHNVWPVMDMVRCRRLVDLPCSYPGTDGRCDDDLDSLFYKDCRRSYYSLPWKHFLTLETLHLSKHKGFFSRPIKVLRRRYLLNGLLLRPKIYSTYLGEALFGAPARNNLAALKRLPADLSRNRYAET